MSQHLTDLMLDQELADIDALPSIERRVAGIRLALRVAARQGRGPLSDVEGVCVNGERLRMSVVRRDGELQVEIERQPEMSRRMG